MTAIQEKGRFDAVKQATQKPNQLAVKRNESECLEFFELRKDYCVVEGRGNFSFFIADTTHEVCQFICKEYLSCAGVFFDCGKRLCTISSFIADFDGPDGTLSQRKGVDGYLFITLLAAPKVSCSFEQVVDDKECGMTVSSEMTGQFATVQGLAHTFNTLEGHYLNLQATNLRAGYTARFQTDYVEIDGTCLMLSYFVFNQVILNVILIDEELEEEQILELYPSHMEKAKWETSYLEFSQSGIHRVVIEATRVEYGISGVGLDDVRLLPCVTFAEQKCLITAFGEDYLGTENTSQSCAKCQPWVESMNYFIAETQFVQPEDEAENFCRNPTKDPFGPWCFINEYGQRESCRISMCVCPSGWFGCKSSGTCFPGDWTCNNVRDCSDGSDEEDPCGQPDLPISEIYLNISFEGSDVAFSAVYELELSSTNAMSGDETFIASPLRNFTENTEVSFQLKFEMEQYDTSNIWVVVQREDDSFSDPITTIEDRSSYEYFSYYYICLPVGQYGLAFIINFGNITMATRTLACDFDGSDTHCPLQTLSSNVYFEWRSIASNNLLQGGLSVLSDDGCDIDIYDLEGTIRSIGYPAGYPNNDICSYTIHIPPGGTLRLEVENFAVEDSNSCAYDYLPIRNGTGQLFKLCGKIAAGTIYEIASESIQFTFFSDYSITDVGFSLKYTTVDLDSTKNYAQALSFGGSDDTGSAISKLIFGPLLVDSKACLHFELFSVEQLEVAQVGNLDRNTESKSLLKLPDIGLGDAWHEFFINIERLASGKDSYIVFKVEMSHPENIYCTTLDVINLTNGNCPGSSNAFDTFACNFNASDQCGYRDTSSVASRWARSILMELQEMFLQTFTTIMTMAMIMKTMEMVLAQDMILVPVMALVLSQGMAPVLALEVIFIQVLLDHQDDAQQMQDKAFGARPGAHSTSHALHYEYLTPKHGSCGKTPWKFHIADTTYTHARCMRECEIANMLSSCGCIDSYMKGDYVSPMEECDLVTYLDCSIPVYEDGDELSNCSVCLSACKSTDFEFDLSSVTLAYTAFSSLNDQIRGDIQTNYMEAMSLQQRVQTTKFLGLLGKNQTLLQAIDDYVFHAKSDISALQQWLFALASRQKSCKF
ncbi:hypothetical protein CAPTEDRAFT_202545 [Capitella teleta]|uniref:Kringle domain-containing protein n=1 Tax=Capitella teleta TaxID=283909 RepID=R7VC56_CAPTE|nr:hypothetical protein CAPTEDRAFT_202545 [Capitella teleta]|eukprot:ELU13901.1 hypothetical protein CAPTEDRAFT_202545 [Capitella teleta]